jgi:DnaJ-class molecular chaperone
MAQRDYYDILGVSRSATPEQIKSAYRRLARKYHPDVNKSKGAAEKFKEATAAYEVLSEPEKRKMYDQFGHAGPPGAGFGQPGGPGRVYTRSYRPGEDVPFDFEDLFASSPFRGMSLEELLGALGGYSARGARQQRPAGRGGGGSRRRQPNVEYPVARDFMQAVKGCTTRLQLRRADGGIERIEVKIPPGVRDGSKVRVRGKGGAGASAEAPDLIIVTQVREHPYFRRDGADIYVDLPISIAEAALGGEVTVPTVDGHAAVKVPPGTASGTRLRLKEKGAPDPKTGKRGDQYAVVKILPPTSLSEQGRKLLEEFARADPYDPRKKVSW